MQPLTILQVRMGSTRLPGKALLDLDGKPVLQHVIERVLEADIGPLVVATSWLPEDRVISDFVNSLGVACYRGQLDDVLTRFATCHAKYGGDPIIRVTADCPLLDIGLLRQIATQIGLIAQDYVGVKGAPAGYHAEAFTAEMLMAAHRWARTPLDREHVVPWMIRNGQCGWVEAYIRGPSVALDTPSDLQRLREMMTQSRGGIVPAGCR